MEKYKNMVLSGLYSIYSSIVNFPSNIYKSIASFFTKDDYEELVGVQSLFEDAEKDAKDSEELVGAQSLFEDAEKDAKDYEELVNREEKTLYEKAGEFMPYPSNVLKSAVVLSSLVGAYYADVYYHGEENTLLKTTMDAGGDMFNSVAGYAQNSFDTVAGYAQNSFDTVAGYAQNSSDTVKDYVQSKQDDESYYDQASNLASTVGSTVANGVSILIDNPIATTGICSLAVVGKFVVDAAISHHNTLVDLVSC